MSAQYMLTQKLYLDPQPGSIPPVFHVKQGLSSSSFAIYVNTGKGFDAVNTNHYCVLKGKKPDGTELYIGKQSAGSGANFRVQLYKSEMEKIADVAGKYLVELTVFETASAVNRRNFSNYDTLTTAKFYVDVEENAYREEV